jgi:DNA-directed RNA polymerase subunit RPC12/RpoP
MRIPYLIILLIDVCILPRIHAKWDKNPYTCEICGQAFDREYTLEVHMNAHNKARPYQCSRCGNR